MYHRNIHALSYPWTFLLGFLAHRNTKFEPPKKGRVLAIFGEKLFLYISVYKLYSCDIFWCVKKNSNMHFRLFRRKRRSTTFLGRAVCHNMHHITYYTDYELYSCGVCWCFKYSSTVEMAGRCRKLEHWVWRNGSNVVKRVVSFKTQNSKFRIRGL